MVRRIRSTEVSNAVKIDIKTNPHYAHVRSAPRFPSKSCRPRVPGRNNVVPVKTSNDRVVVDVSIPRDCYVKGTCERICEFVPV